MNSNNLVQDLIASARSQMKALDAVLAMLERQLEVPAVDDKLRCPECGTEIDPETGYQTMGISGEQYACPKCVFRGVI